MTNKFGEYTFLSRAGSGGFGQCYVATKKGDDKAYILKTININEKIQRNIKNLRNEIDKLNILNNNPKNDYIPVIYHFDKCLEKSKPIPYYVMDYFSRGNLYYYVNYEKYDLLERQVKLIFKKILLAIQFCHNRNICHLDIKPENIVFDKDFQPMILDFGYAEKFVDENNNIIPLKEGIGTENYMCPEMWDNKKYDGRKADIFSLGALLFNLVTGKAGFSTSEKDDEFYKFIRTKDIGNYWKTIFIYLPIQLSDNFKKLYISMITYKPEQRLNTIEEILQSDWMEEINNLTDEEYTELENEVRNKLLSLYDKIQENSGELNMAENIQQMGYNTRSGVDQKNSLRYYDESKIPKNIPKDRININHCLKINGLSNGVKFMDLLVDEIDQRFRDVCLIETSKEELKFKLIYVDEVKGDCEIEVELYEYETGGYLLEFLRTKGRIPNYYHRFMELKKFIFEKFQKIN